MKRKSPAKRKHVLARAQGAAASTGAVVALEPVAGEAPGKIVEHEEPFVADEEERQVEDSPETDVAPDRLDRNAPERRTSSPDACGLAEDAAVPGSDLD